MCFHMSPKVAFGTEHLMALLAHEDLGVLRMVHSNVSFQLAAALEGCGALLHFAAKLPPC